MSSDSNMKHSPSVAVTTLKNYSLKIYKKILLIFGNLFYTVQGISPVPFPSPPPKKKMFSLIKTCSKFLEKL